MISVEVVEGGTAPMQVLANHDHFRDMNRMFWEWRATGVYTDLELICQVRSYLPFLSYPQCCGSGIRCLFYPWIRDG
jgi:hypothetical protein